MRAATTELQKKPAPVSGVRTEASVAQISASSCFSLANLPARPSALYSLKGGGRLLIVSVVKINEIMQVKALGTMLTDC